MKIREQCCFPPAEQIGPTAADGRSPADVDLGASTGSAVFWNPAALVDFSIAAGADRGCRVRQKSGTRIQRM